MGDAPVNPFRQRIERCQYRWLLLPQALLRQRRTVRAIRRRGHVRVVFLVSSLPMWRCQPLCDRLAADGRFDVSVALYPFPSYSREQQDACMKELSEYFAGKDVPFVDLSAEERPGEALKWRLDPDILFYQQPYNYLYGKDLDSPAFPDCLVCYVPYSIRTSSGTWVYRTRLNETAWRLFYPSPILRDEAASILYNKGRNIRVTGDPQMDCFSFPPQKDPWKPLAGTKRVIWAPHFSIVDEGLMHRDSFTWLSECMLRFAAQYRDRIQFVFKPHPRLLSELCAHPDWGKEKAGAYYKAWAEGPNTQLVTGEYLDLFKTSDAMIHDSGSFSVEYPFTGKPVLFTTRDLDRSLTGQNELGCAAIRAHYPGRSEADIAAFLDDVVLGGKDPMKAERAAFVDKYLRASGRHSAAEAIYQAILDGLQLER